MRRLRQTVQLLALAVFIGLVWTTTWPLSSPLPVSLFLRLDPLAALAVAFSPARSWDLLRLFWPSLVLLGATVALGRFFCGWLCPLGTCLDVSDRVLSRWRKRRRPAPDKQLGWLKYALLAATLGASLFGVPLLLLLDPLCLATRTVGTFVHPALSLGYNGLAFVTEPVRSALGWRMDLGPVHLFRLGLAVGVMFLTILALGLSSRRFWCRNLCPLGALLGFAGAHGLWRRIVRADRCSACRRCATECKMGAIPAKAPCTTRQAECIQCYDCVACCKPLATTLALSTGAAGLDPKVNVGRREFLAATGIGVGYGLLAAVGIVPRPRPERLIRPPGAVVRDDSGALTRLMTESEFRAKCLRCGQCLKACPTGGLQPSLIEAGLDGFYTPRLVPQVGWCEQNCAACGAACPSGALVPFRIEEKPRIQIGLAEIHRDRCLSWRTGGEYSQCTICKEYCSYEAIDLVSDQGQLRPVVRHGRCTGCGLCENACPVRDPDAAIVVYRREGSG
jgi:polyferredoxin